MRAHLFILPLLLIVAACSSAKDGEPRWSGELTMPPAPDGPSPAVILVPGTAGIDSRISFHRRSLLKAGIAAYVVDFKTGVFTSAQDRPRNITFLPWLYDALDRLAADPRIDPERIAVMGFSLGGHLAMNAYSASNTARFAESDRRFSAFVSFYPSCRHLLGGGYDKKPSGGPGIMFLGSEDSYATPQQCQTLVDRINDIRSNSFELVVYPGAHHAFDRRGPSAVYRDPATRTGKGYVAHDKGAARDSQARYLEFLQRVFGLETTD